MAGIVGIVFGVASLDDLVADLEEGFLELGDALAGFDFDVYDSRAEFRPKILIGQQTTRFLARKPGALGDAAKGVIHRPVQGCEERYDLLPPARLVVAERGLRGTDRDIHQEIALNWRPAEVEVYLGFNRDRLEKLIRQ